MTNIKFTALAILLAAGVSTAFAATDVTSQKQNTPAQPPTAAATAKPAATGPAITEATKPEIAAKARHHVRKHHHKHIAHAKHKHMLKDKNRAHAS
jgi:hypothetical protein